MCLRIDFFSPTFDNYTRNEVVYALRLLVRFAQLGKLARSQCGFQLGAKRRRRLSVGAPIAIEGATKWTAAVASENDSNHFASGIKTNFPDKLCEKVSS